MAEFAEIVSFFSISEFGLYRDHVGRSERLLRAYQTRRSAWWKEWEEVRF